MVFETDDIIHDYNLESLHLAGCLGGQHHCNESEAMRLVASTRIWVGGTLGGRSLEMQADELSWLDRCCDCGRGGWPGGGGV